MRRLGKGLMVPKGTGKNQLERRTGGHPLRRWVVNFIRDSEYKISGNEGSRLDFQSETD